MEYKEIQPCMSCKLNNGRCLRKIAVEKVDSIDELANISANVVGLEVIRAVDNGHGLEVSLECIFFEKIEKKGFLSKY